MTDKTLHQESNLPTKESECLQRQTKKPEIIGFIIGLTIALVLGTYLFQVADCGDKQRSLAWGDIGTPNVENGYKQMYNSCHNIFGQDYTHSFDNLLQFYPNLQSWRNAQ